MSRYSKFRGWNTISETFFERELQLQQSTGSNDKLGKEIYEGDLVKHDRGWIKQINYELGSFMVGDYPIRDYILAKDITVVGNIYENPEILTK